MISFSKDYDKPEGIVQSIVLPDISRSHSDDSSNLIKENNFENFANLTGNIFKNLILSFEIFQSPPLLGLLGDFPLVFDASLSTFNKNLKENPSGSYSTFTNDLFSLFDPSKNPAGDLVQPLAQGSIRMEATNSKNITEIEINDLVSCVTEIEEIDFSALNKNQLEIIESYANYFIIKFIASNFLITFTPAPPVPPIILPLITSDPSLTKEQIIEEFKQTIKDIIVTNINSI